ncbi:hypothetical protein HPB50_016539 [Hyalomma asiaticum]|uniref:Uncharacterized protein n=1 Tax=Hyalomma asiaticum TaxID=266040 RepID=A0ACB7SWZ8_HYAAI|nr:hypothetical protein HPB50_016539 [Hyalomma asiaticum]
MHSERSETRQQLLAGQTRTCELMPAAAEWARRRFHCAADMKEKTKNERRFGSAKQRSIVRERVRRRPTTPNAVGISKNVYTRDGHAGETEKEREGGLARATCKSAAQPRDARARPQPSRSPALYPANHETMQ